MLAFSRCAYAALLATVALGLPRAARADDQDEISTHRLLPLVPLNFAPAGIGTELAVGPNATNGPLFVLGWPLQFPLEDITPERPSQRVVFAPEVVVGELHAGNPDRTVTGELRFRGGYRVTWHPGGSMLGLLAGIGSTLEFYPVVRPSISPEVGLHIGDPMRIPKLTVVVRFDQYFQEDNTSRIGAQVGWCFY